MPVLDYIEEQFAVRVDRESRVERGDLSDTLVHACLFFIPPTGHGLKPLDVEFMKKIHDKVFSFYLSKYDPLLM